MSKEINEILNASGAEKAPIITSDNSATGGSEIPELKKQISDLQWTNDFNTIATKYPFAREFGDKIREKVDKGYSVEDATIAVLGKESKLKTADEIREEENKGKGLGGSAATPNLDNSANAPKTLAEHEEAFRQAEARGEIKIA